MNLDSGLLTKKNIIILLGSLFFLAAIVFTLFLLRQTQIFRSRADAGQITFSGPSVKCNPDSTESVKCSTDSATVQIGLNSPWGYAPVGFVFPTQVPTQAPTQAPSPTQTPTSTTTPIPSVTTPPTDTPTATSTPTPTPTTAPTA
ncbi:MAG: hypothetical protein Q7S88_00590, partial [Candidatus Daviesbacteria bacterium]|nr:hypothetical protein [Candidatus Daviesbacteria bacterium]